ncbi:hypothetical protein SEVIR_5G166400v4 [Setaria viridis]|uniref:Dehydrin n=2 Tax=Setaria TaxID=4554 RepID=K3XN23_SETIT|nr:dehydrin DHN3 [Setaria italica]XP_034597514.1 dehydrin DHN3-like [Setaria viridis]RCV25434.1 hypothetical protein SETIT_5G166200v2 [Setaria italica]TKW14416.1 hypothetical protein SEVIR_5G166400v2 [Setaria viridis]
MEYQGQHGHATNQANEYGNPVAAGHGATGVGAAGDQVQPMRDDHKTDGLLRRSGSSSSSSSEDDGMGGRRKKGIKEKIKEKLPGGNKDSTGQQHTTTGGAVGQQGHAGATGTGAHGTEGTGEKKGLMNKIKEKLPGQH